MRINTSRILDVIARSERPIAVWQKQFDGLDEELRQMCRMDWEEIPHSYLCDYFLDLKYVELQPDLLRYVFPACLKYWYKTLMLDATSSVGLDDLNDALGGDNLLRHLTSREVKNLNLFLADCLLDRLESQLPLSADVSQRTTSDHVKDSWLPRLNSVGTFAPVVEYVWTDWWSVNHIGKARCSLLYTSGLIYSADENVL